MPSTKEIKGRMKSVSDTQKITNCMYMIASTKMRRAKAELDKTRPYFDALQTEIERVFQVDRKIKSKYFYEEDIPGKKESDTDRAKRLKVERGAVACLVITADKGLAGAYNQNILKAAMAMREEYTDLKLFVVGEYGRRFFDTRHIAVEKSFLYTAQNPTISRAREIGKVLLDQFDKNEIREIYILYTDLKSSIREEVIKERLLPFYRSDFKTEKGKGKLQKDFEFVPNLRTVLETSARNYLPGYVYSALVDSFCSEQNARMEAMSAASDNAEKIMDKLRLQYHRARQAAITREITEVSAGAKAQRKKKLKKLEEMRSETGE